MKYSEVNSKTEQALKTDLLRIREEVAKLSMQKRQGQLKSPKELNTHRKTIARILTALRAGHHN